MQIKGKIHEIGPTTDATPTVKKRELILEYIENPQYPEYLKFEVINDKCTLLDPLRPGQDVEVFFNLRGRPWTDTTGKKIYFNSFQLWKISVVGGTAAPVYSAPADLSSSPDDDPLPF
jgi:hypothetical protein